MQENGMDDVDFIINVYESTYRTVLTPGYIKQLTASNKFAFRKVVLVVNNVADPDAVRVLAAKLVNTGEIDAYVLVGEQLDRALRMAGLTKDDLDPVAYYSDWAFVAVFLPGVASWICHWDAEVCLREPVDWISPSIRLMQQDERIAVANPNWAKEGLDRVTRFVTGEFSIGYGFSDQVFLLRTSEFARPIYRHFAPVSLRYPLAHISPIFEQRVDSYMRTQRRLRATYRGAQYFHPNEGSSYPKLSPKQSAARLLIKTALVGMRMLPLTDPRWTL